MNVAQRFRVPFVLPSFNDLESAARKRARGYANLYAQMKAELQPQIVNAIRRARLQPVAPGVMVSFLWIERDRRRDPLDIRPACKFIMDALCGADRPGDRQARAGILHCDGMHCVRAVLDDFGVDPLNAGVEVAVLGDLRVPRVAPPGWPFEVRA